MTYTTIQQQLDHLQIESTAAEVHGQLCGLLCTCDSSRAKSLWFAAVLSSFQNRPGELSEKASVNSGALAELDRLFGTTCEQLDSEDMNFALLIETDSVVAIERMVCLADWCSGFVYGFGMGTGGKDKSEKLPEDTNELIEDFLNISRFKPDNDSPGDDDDHNDADLVEIEEYIRVGVLLIREEMHEALDLRDKVKNAEQNQQFVDDNSSPTIH